MNTHHPLIIEPIPAFKDNYIWALRRDTQLAIVDPGDAAPVFAYMQQRELTLTAILTTHHHADHVGGVAQLLAQHSVPVFGPKNEPIQVLTHAVSEGDELEIPQLDVRFRVIDVPGHTRAHIAYYGAGALFCGDTLFACGCGRLFEGTPAQMRTSLTKLRDLPDDTLVYCAHEYTLSNISFARMIDPNNAALIERERRDTGLRAANRPTLPSTLGEEKRTNPFLRWETPEIIQAAQQHLGAPAGSPDQVFAAIRDWKNRA